MGKTADSSTHQDAERYSFYNQDDPERYGDEEYPDIRSRIDQLITDHVDASDWVVELGSGKCVFDDCHPNYVGIDLSLQALRRFASPSVSTVQADIQRLPLASGSARFIFTINALEHVPFPEEVLSEIDRSLSPGGILLLDPAWFCRPWVSEALHLRSYSQLSWSQRLRKMTIPFRDNLLVRAGMTFPRRLWRELRERVGRTPLRFDYRRLDPNLDEYLCTDSDAFTSMDPHAALLYFRTRGYDVLRPKGALRQFLVRHEPLVLKKPFSSREFSP